MSELKKENNLPSIIGSKKEIQGEIRKDIKAALQRVSIENTFTNSSSKEEKFRNEVAELATSDEVILKLSDELGNPKEGETEQEFVDRGKNVLRNILKSTLTKGKG